MDHKGKQAWLEGLKTGDMVVAERGHGYRSERIAKVLSTTATIIRISSESTHVPHLEYRRKDGLQRGGEWHQRIKPLTPDVAERIERKGVSDRLVGIKWGDLSLDVLRQVSALVGYKAEE